MDCNKYKYKMTMRALLFFEKLSGKSFFEISTEEDAEMLKYSILVNSNEDLLMTYDVYKIFASDKKVRKWIDECYEKAALFIGQIKMEAQKNSEEYSNEDNDSEPMTITRIVYSLIIQHGVSAEYVMNEMQLYEILDLFNAAESKMKSELVDKRFWTYLQILPQIDGKKIKSPEKLVPFQWEKGEIKKRAERELKKFSPKIIGQELNI